MSFNLPLQLYKMVMSRPSLAKLLCNRSQVSDVLRLRQGIIIKNASPRVISCAFQVKGLVTTQITL